MNHSKSFTLILYALVFALILGLFLFLLRSPTPEIPYSEMVSLFEKEKVSAFTTKDNAVTMTLREPYEGSSEVICRVGDTDYFRDDLGALVRSQKEAGILTEYSYLPDSKPSVFLEILPYILLIGAMLFFFFVVMNRAGGGNPNGMDKFGKANPRIGLPDDKKVTFKDVAGAEEEKESLQEIVDFLRDPEKYRAMGAKIPKGVLLVGPPGTGKTLIARAVAGEADVQFLSISGSDFVEMYVGVGASRVRDLFETAKKTSPSIIFIDEIDAVGRRRGAGLGGGHDEREQTLNQLLVEMDGFRENEGIIVLAATNRKDILDPALLRPGRFDRQVCIGLPDAKGREAILRVHTKGKPLSDDVDLGTVARASAGFSGAELSNLVNEAALAAVKAGRPVITMADLEEAMMKRIAGPEKKSREVTAHERRLTAVHEAGHAVAMYRLPTQDPVHQITVVPRGSAGGMTISLPDHDKNYYSRNEMFESIVSFLGGRIAEDLELGDISTGASNDIQRATEIARDMIAKYGMSDALGTVSYESEDEVFIGRDYEKTKSYSERTAGEIDDELRRIVDRAYSCCREILEENRTQLRQVADFLFEHGTMDREQFLACMEGREIPAQTSASLFDLHRPQE